MALPVAVQVYSVRNDAKADLKGTLEIFAKKLYGENTKVRFRPHHFPFTEPSAEMDGTCFRCGGKGCRFCKGEATCALFFNICSWRCNIC